MAGDIIRPSALPPRVSPVASEIVPSDNGSIVGGVTIAAMVNAGRPLASQAEAEAGTDAAKSMTPLTTKQALYALGDVRFASAAQGVKADSAVQSLVAGTYTTIDDTDPNNPIISYNGSAVTDGNKRSVTVSGSGAIWKLSDIISVKDFGAIGDDTEDETEAFQDAIDFIVSQGGGTILIPRGVYWFPAASPSLSPGGVASIRFVGQGYNQSILHFDEGVSAGEKSLFYEVNGGGSQSLQFEGIGFLGTFEDDDGREGGVPLYLDKFGSVVIRDCSFRNLKQMGMDLHFLRHFECTGCFLENIAADGIRCRDTPNQIITNNYLLRLGDDAIACHVANYALSSAGPIVASREGVIIANNQIVNAAGIRVLGARRLVVSGNSFEFPNYHAVFVGDLPIYGEGGVHQRDILITDNVVSNLVAMDGAGVQVNYPAAFHFEAPAVRGVAAFDDTMPGEFYGAGATFLYPWDWDEEVTTDAGTSIIPVRGVRVAGNIVRRTAAVAAAFSDYGYGTRLNQGISNDLPLTNANLRYRAGLRVVGGGLINARIENNQFDHALNGIEFAAPTTKFDYQGVVISKNTFFDCINRGVALENAALTVGIEVSDNYIDCDPYRLNANSNIDGTYDADLSLPRGVDVGDLLGVSILRNTFRNCLQPWATNNNDKTLIRANVLYTSPPVATGFNGGNRGIGVIPNAGERASFVFCNSNPQDPSFRVVTFVQYFQSSTMPASGMWVAGAFVTNTAPAISAGKVILGWIRLTTGTGNVLNTDWAACYATNS